MSTVNKQLERLVKSRQKKLGIEPDQLEAVLSSLARAYPGDDPVVLIAADTPAALSESTDYVIDGDAAELLIEAAKRERPSQSQSPSEAPARSDTSGGDNSAIGALANAVSELVQSQTAHRPLSELSLSELLEKAQAEPGKQIILQAIAGLPEIQVAEAKTNEWAATKDKRLDIPGTLAYVAFLGKDNATARRKYKGLRTASVAAALGLKETDLVHPLTDSEALVEGQDSKELDWAFLLDNRDLYRAVVWARRSNPQHRFWPQGADWVDVHEALCKEKLPSRWQTILEEYLELVDEEDPEANVSLVFKQPAQGRTNPLSQSTQPAPDRWSFERPAAIQPPAIRVNSITGGDVDGNRRDVIVGAGVKVGGDLYNAVNVTIERGASVGGDVHATGKVINHGNIGGDVRCSEYDGTGRVGGDIRY